MALPLRSQVSQDGKALGGKITRPYQTKSFFRVPDVKARPALGSIQNTLPEKALHNVAMKPKSHLINPVVPTTVQTVTSVRDNSPESMDVVQEISEAFSDQLHIDDIDTQDADNPQLCAEYAKDIYEYMREIEQTYHTPPTYIKSQPEVNEKMRSILIDWLVQVHHRFNLLQETLYLTVSIIDRYLMVTPVPKTKLQLVGVTAMLIASKYEEMYAPEVRDFVYITDNTYTSPDIRDMEREMLRVLEYSFGNPLCLHFLRRNSRAGDATPQMHTMAKFLMEICLTDYSMLEYLPSQIAAAALYISNKLYSDGQWSPVLRHYSTYSESDILPCVNKISQIVLNMHTSKQQAVKNKYSSSKFLRIAKEPCLTGKVMKELVSLR